MSKLIPLDEAARMLGISVDRLTEMRSNNEIFGYRDGANWKFKETEISRVADELGISLGAGAVEDDDFELSDSSGDDSLELLQDSSADLLLDESADDLSLSDSGDDLGSASNIMDDEDELLFGGSSLKLAAGQSDSDTPDSVDVHDDELAPKDPRSSTGKLLAAMQDSDDDPLALAPMEDDMELVGDDSSNESAELGSDFEDSEIVLDDSDSENDLILDSSDNLSLNLDSGSDLVLQASLDAGGSDIDNLELAADDDVLSLGDMADPDAATMMQEDDFNLSPMEESDADDSSGSQVIALEDSDLFADSGAPLSESGEGLDAAELLDDGGLEPAYADEFGGEALAGVGVAGGGVVVGKPEVPYSLMQVLSLATVALILAIGCTLLWDIARNLWYPADRVVQNGLMKVVMDMLGISG